MKLSDFVRGKIFQQVQRAFSGEEVHRITKVTEGSLLFRLPWVGKILIQKDDDAPNGINIPQEVECE